MVEIIDIVEINDNIFSSFITGGRKEQSTAKFISNAAKADFES